MMMDGDNLGITFAPADSTTLEESGATPATKSMRFAENLPKRGVISCNDLLKYPENERHNVICQSPMVEIRRRKSMMDTNAAKHEFTPLKLPGKKDEFRKITRRLSMSILKTNNALNQSGGTPITVTRSRASCTSDEDSVIEKSFSLDSIETISKLRDVFNLQRKRLQYAIGDWNCVLREEEKRMPEEAVDSLCAALGKCNLLLDKKFTFFEDLLGKAEQQAKNVLDDCPMVSLDDLLGYFQTVYDQIKAVDSSFDALENWRNKEWSSEVKQKTPVRSTIKRTLTKKVNSVLNKKHSNSPSMFSKFLSKRKAAVEAAKES